MSSNNQSPTSTSKNNWQFRDFGYTKVLDSLVKNNPNLPFGVYFGMAMKMLRGKVSGVEVEYYIRQNTKGVDGS